MTHRDKARHHLRRIGWILLATLAVDAIGTVVVYLFERNADGTKIHTIGDSLFWTTTQLLTVSSQLPNPISTGGRIFDVFLQFWAISLVTTLAGSFAGVFHHRVEHKAQQVERRAAT
jgi:voltage-gated potassium channel